MFYPLGRLEQSIVVRYGKGSVNFHNQTSMRAAAFGSCCVNICFNLMMVTMRMPLMMMMRKRER